MQLHKEAVRDKQNIAHQLAKHIYVLARLPTECQKLGYDLQLETVLLPKDIKNTRHGC